jgi:hypothetical protein
MCTAFAAAFGTSLLSTGAALGTQAAQAKTSETLQKRAMQQSNAQYNTLLSEQAEENSKSYADAAQRALNLKDAQRLLAISGGGTIATSPLGTGTNSFGSTSRKTLLGE